MLNLSTFCWISLLFVESLHFYLNLSNFGWISPLLFESLHFWLNLSTFIWISPLLVESLNFLVESLHFLVESLHFLLNPSTSTSNPNLTFTQAQGKIILFSKDLTKKYLIPETMLRSDFHQRFHLNINMKPSDSKVCVSQRLVSNKARTSGPEAKTQKPKGWFIRKFCAAQKKAKSQKFVL